MKAKDIRDHVFYEIANEMEPESDADFYRYAVLVDAPRPDGTLRPLPIVVSELRFEDRQLTGDQSIALSLVDAGRLHEMLGRAIAAASAYAASVAAAGVCGDKSPPLQWCESEDSLVAEEDPALPCHKPRTRLCRKRGE